MENKLGLSCAQLRLNLVVLNYDFIWTKKSWPFFFGSTNIAKILFGIKTFSKIKDDLITLVGRVLKIF